MKYKIKIQNEIRILFRQLAACLGIKPKPMPSKQTNKARTKISVNFTTKLRNTYNLHAQET